MFVDHKILSNLLERCVKKHDINRKKNKVYYCVIISVKANIYADVNVNQNLHKTHHI